MMEPATRRRRTQAPNWQGTKRVMQTSRGSCVGELSTFFQEAGSLSADQINSGITRKSKRLHLRPVCPNGTNWPFARFYAIVMSNDTGRVYCPTDASSIHPNSHFPRVCESLFDCETRALADGPRGILRLAYNLLGLVQGPKSKVQSLGMTSRRSRCDFGPWTLD